MDRDRFVSLIVGYCKLCSIDAPMDVVHGTPIETGGVLFSLIHSEKIDPRLLLIYADVGPAPQDGDTDAYQALLGRNFFFCARRGPVFSISPESGRLLLTQAQALAELTPALLANLLEEVAAAANEWRQNPFDTARAAASRPATTGRAKAALGGGRWRAIGRR